MQPIILQTRHFQLVATTIQQSTERNLPNYMAGLNRCYAMYQPSLVGLLENP